MTRLAKIRPLVGELSFSPLGIGITLGIFIGSSLHAQFITAARDAALYLGLYTLVTVAAPIADRLLPPSRSRKLHLPWIAAALLGLVIADYFWWHI